MKKMILIISIISLLIMGCSEDAPTATMDCAALETTVEEAGTAFDASQTTATCTALATAAQAALIGGCPWCEADAEACLEDGSNEDACCDEPSQAEIQDLIDGLTAGCDGYGDSTDDGDDDDSPPECFDDCDYEPSDDSTGTEICEFIGGDIACTDDCIGDDAIPEELIGICAACLAAGNCDELFDDEDDGGDDDDAPPECTSDCAGYASMVGEDETDDLDVWCGWFSTWSIEGCLSDCTDDELEEAEILEIVAVCTECLANNNCEEMLEGDDDVDDGECLLDCPLSMFTSPTGMCEFVGAGNSSCLDDCSEENALFFQLMPIMCGTCVADGNCDEIFDDDDDGDDGDDGGE